MGMEYIYAALMLHEVKNKVEESDLEQVLKAAGVEPDPARIKQLVSNLSSLNIDEIVSQAAVTTTAPAPAPAPAEESKAEEKKEEKKEEKEKEEEEAALAGLGALFG